MNLTEWTNMWDEKIRKWYENPQEYFDNDDIYKAYTGSGDAKLQVKVIPEPYLGDINSKCSGVVLSLNPAESLPNGEQQWPNGQFVKDVSATNYSEWAKTWYYLKNKNIFWKNRKEWLDRKMSNANESLYPFAIELIPYHSKACGTLSSNENKNLLEYVENNILVVAEEMTKNCALKLVFCFGKPYYDIFRSLNYEIVLKIDSEDHENFKNEWPIGNSKPINRTYIIWKSQRGSLYFHTYYSGGFWAPKEEFEEVEKLIIKEIEKKYNCTIEDKSI
ncbi:hypothetical protein [Clostridium estertheticum]|uniref:hypothetical protein n=1 Tax=Clostridium estertheticum TaxID=238834 RepID=UPI001C7D3140|nr:hypothetical protein [Clostridium estertheticum]MBX4263124.1 hypothetical protein [Clostridium estertheticum]WLC89437.1 hypothetical protein KTC95_04240 [Clostridium estertheticum]